MNANLTQRHPTYLHGRTVMTYALAMAAARDTANHQAKSNHRTEWTEDDYNLACRTLANLFPECGANPNAGLSRE